MLRKRKDTELDLFGKPLSPRKKQRRVTVYSELLQPWSTQWQHSAGSGDVLQSLMDAAQISQEEEEEEEEEDLQNVSSDPSDLCEFKVNDMRPPPYLCEVDQQYPGVSEESEEVSEESERSCDDKPNISETSSGERSSCCTKISESSSGERSSCTKISEPSSSERSSTKFVQYPDPDNYPCNYRHSAVYNSGSEYNKKRLSKFKEVVDCIEESHIDFGEENMPLYDRFTRHQFGGGSSSSRRRDYILQEVGRRFFKRFGAERADYKLMIQPPGDDILSLKEEEENPNFRLNSIIKDIQRTVDPQDWFGMYLDNPNMKDPLWITARRADQLDSDAVLSAFYKIFESYNMFLFQGIFTLKVVHIRFPEGAGKRGRTRNPLVGKSMLQFLKIKRSVVAIENNDDICLARAIVVAKAIADGDKDKAFFS